MSLLSFIDLLDFYRTLAQPDGAAAANVYQIHLSAGYFCNFGCLGKKNPPEFRLPIFFVWNIQCESKNTLDENTAKTLKRGGGDFLTRTIDDVRSIYGWFLGWLRY